MKKVLLSLLLLSAVASFAGNSDFKDDKTLIQSGQKTIVVVTSDAFLTMLLQNSRYIVHYEQYADEKTGANTHLFVFKNVPEAEIIIMEKTTLYVSKQKQSLTASK
jgi:hypothetical protein